MNPVSPARCLRVALLAAWLMLPGAAHAGSYDELFAAMRAGNTEAVSGFLRAGVSADLADNAGTTLLMMAARSLDSRLTRSAALA